MTIDEMATDLTFEIGRSELDRADLRYKTTQDTITELLSALHDAIRLNSGEVPESAMKFFCDEEFKSTRH